MNIIRKAGFTLVELLAVIVILAIILVIAVPKIMSVIEDAKKATLESTAKMIANAAEKSKVQNTLLGSGKGINCKDIVQINDIDYEKCIIDFDNNGNALVTIKGSGKFDNLNVCDGDKTDAAASNTACTVSYGNGATYIEKLEAFNGSENKLEKKSVEYNGTTYDAGIRYVGAMNEVKNQVYFNCEDKDSSGISYGEENYNYASSCEVWRIIGVFEVDNGSGEEEKRLKIINTASTFKASFDSSASSVNEGYGVNQWGEVKDVNGNITYAGADLMQLLNGYYINKTNSTCTYCNGLNQETCEQICTTESLTSVNMKPLTTKAKNMIGNAVWDTYGVTWVNVRDVTWAPTAYLQEKGISKQYTGKICSATSIYAGKYLCTDTIERTTSWTGLVGLMSVSDITYANGWLYSPQGTSLYPLSISPLANSVDARAVWVADEDSSNSRHTSDSRGVWPAVYLKSNIQIIGGDGNIIPYKLNLIPDNN